MRAIQTVLIIVGALIFFGFAFIGVEVYRRATDPTHPRSWVARTEPGVTPGIPAGEQAGGTRIAQPNQAALSRSPEPPVAEPITLPAGSEIGTPATAGNRAVFRVVLPDGTQQMHVLDPRTGQVTVMLSAPPAPQRPAGAPGSAP